MFSKLKIDTKVLKELDFGVLIVSIIIMLYGTINIYSATKAKYGIYYLKQQAIWLVLCLILTYVVLLVDYTILQNYANIIYWLTIGLLVITKYSGMGKTVNGARGWIRIGSFGFQPAELAKLAMIIMLAKKLEEMEGNINNVKNFFELLFYAAVPMALIVIQPDMGMTMVCFFIVLGIFFAAGLNGKVIVGGFMGVLTVIALLWNSGLMQEYWKRRLTSFINPQADELGMNLQLSQSKIGIGSGGLFGTGPSFLPGAKRSYVAEFVPEAHNDFIFAVSAEQWGYIGAIFLLTLYGIFIYRTIKIAKSSKDIFGSIICIGVVSTFLFSIFQNIGMTIGLMPITGITLPLMSYGGSSALTNFLAIALVLNVGMRRKKINF